MDCRLMLRLLTWDDQVKVDQLVGVCQDLGPRIRWTRRPWRSSMLCVVLVRVGDLVL